MSGTLVVYNSVQLKDVQTLRFEQSVEYDESRTDVLYHKFVVRVAGSAHDDPTHFHGVESTLTTPSTSVDAAVLLQRQLMHPRGHFEYYAPGGVLLLAADPNPTSSHLDVNNGPKPLSCSVSRVVGSKLLAVEFEIEISRIYCPLGLGSDPTSFGGAKTNPRVLNNRWSLTEERDPSFYGVRVLEGVLRVSHVEAIPHRFRYLCVPPLQRGYRRESMTFWDSPDGLTLRYKILDRQKFAAPPPPAVDWEATYTETSGPGGQIGWGEMNIKLLGGPSTSKADLIAAGREVVRARLGNINTVYHLAGGGEYVAWLENAAIVEHLHDNVVHVMARVRHQTDQGQRILNAQIDKMGQPLSLEGYDSKSWPVPGVFDFSAPYGLFAKYLQSPCIDLHGIPNPDVTTPEGDGELNPGFGGEDGGTELSIFHGQTPTTEFDDQSGTNNPHLTSGFPYTYVTMENHYDLRDGVMQLPVARWGGGSSGPRPSSVIIPIHEPIGKRSIVVHAERIGAYPELPDPLPIGLDLNAITQIRTWRKLVVDAPEIMADGKTRLFKAQERIEYALERAPDNSEVYAGGATPVDESDAADNIFDGYLQFVTGKYW